MSEGANETAVSFAVSPTATTTGTAITTENTLKTTLECRVEDPNTPSQPPPSPSPTKTTTKITHVVRKHRKHATTGRTFHRIDGKKIRSALTHKKWLPQDRRVSFPLDDNDLVTGYLEPANPWEHAENVNIEDLISSYKASCQRHGAEPLENLIAQLEKLDISDDERCPELSLKHECLDQYHCEPLEELLKRVQFEKIDAESASLDDESATILFDMLEYYQSARHLNMSSNRNIGSRGWQACAQMIKKTTCLEQLEARDITLTQQHMNILKRPLQLVSHLHVLKLENCGLAGRAFVILVSALKMNTGLKELYLADNCFVQEDAIQLGALLRVNNHLQLLDISNNHIKDEGVRDLLDGLIAQTGDRRNGKGLGILVLWNNELTRSSSPHFSEAITQSASLETLNIGKNSVSNELLELAQEALIKSRTLLQLGMQSTNITCKGALLLATIIERNRSLQRIDLRDNNIQMEGLAALSFAMKRNPCVTQLDLDSTPWSKTPATMNQYLDLVAEIGLNCARNEESMSTDESTEESSSPQHRSRLSSVSSRKISLTCQTLPRSPPSIVPSAMNDITARSMLEPKRTSGGRLRSPAPSPIPSPVASPIPSPSRGRFVVSRVCETSLSSTNSSASSSPLTPSSLASSPTCFFPTSVGSSRFRVTVVEPSATTGSNFAPAKSVVTSANANVTIGFNYKVSTPENPVDSDDSDSVFRSDDEHSGTTINEQSSSGIDIGVENETKAACAVETNNERMNVNDVKNENEEFNDITMRKVREIQRIQLPGKIEDNQSDVEVKREENGAIVNDLVDEKKDIQRVELDVTKAIPGGDRPGAEIIETKVKSSKRSEESLRDEIMACYESESKKPEPPVQRQATSLERLLGLFQHPGSLFSTSSFAERTELKNPLQDGVNSMIALGDKFQQYLREGRGTVKSGTEDSPSHPPLQRSVSDASRSNVKIDPVKSLSIPQLSSIQATCTRDDDSRNVDSRLMENSTDNFRTKLESVISGSRKIFIVDESTPDNVSQTTTDEVPRINAELSLPEIAQTAETQSHDNAFAKSENSLSNVSKENNSCPEIMDNSSLCLVNECKTSVCPKLKDIPEYSILVIRDTKLEANGNDEFSLRNKKIDETSKNDDNDEDNAKTKCDSSTTDSINDPSYKNSSHCKVTCDISGVKNVHTLESSTGDVHNFFNSPLSHENSTIRHDEERAMISDFTSLYDDENVAITSESHEEVNGTKNSSYRHNDTTDELSGETINLENRNFNDKDKRTECDKLKSKNEKPTDYSTNNLELSLMAFDNSRINYINDGRTLVSENVRLTDTIEEFLPLDAAASSVESSNLTKESLTELSNNSVNDSRDVASRNERESSVRGNEDFQENNFSIISDETEVTSTMDAKVSSIDENLPDETISDLFVRVPNSSIVSREFAITRIAIEPIDDDDYVQASAEQISSSLSEDSGYSGKLSVDDVRNGEPSVGCSTENSPANDTSERIVGDASIIDNSHESINSRFNETSLNTTNHISFVRAAVDSVLTTILNVTEVTTRHTPTEIKSSESSEDLMFKMTDITSDGAAFLNEFTSSVVTTIRVCEDDSTSIVDRYYEAGQSSGSGGNLFIDKSRKVHRNSQDSGIEETTASISEDNGLETIVQPRESFQESVDSGIDSECSSVCARVDVGADAEKERVRDPGKSTNSATTANDEKPRFSTSHVDINDVLGTKDIVGKFDDSTSRIRINDERKLVTNIGDVVGIGRVTKNEVNNVVDVSTSPE